MSGADILTAPPKLPTVAMSVTDSFPQAGTQLSSQVESGSLDDCYSCTGARATGWPYGGLCTKVTYFSRLGCEIAGSQADASSPQFCSGERLSTTIALSNWLLPRGVGQIHGDASADLASRSFYCSSPENSAVLATGARVENLVRCSFSRFLAYLPTWSRLGDSGIWSHSSH